MEKSMDNSEMQIKGIQELLFLCFSMESAIHCLVISPSLTFLSRSSFPTSLAISFWLSPEEKLDRSAGHHPRNDDSHALVPALPSPPQWRASLWVSASLCIKEAGGWDQGTWNYRSYKICRSHLGPFRATWQPSAAITWIIPSAGN